MRILFLFIICFFTACSSKNPIKVETNIDLDKFMGDWYVIAYSPVFIDKEAYNGIESYKLNQDGSIATTYTFNKGSFNGEKKEYNPKGFVVKDTGNAIWKMQFIWPFKSDYRIMYVDETYTNTIIARQNRDYFWIMSRNKEIPNTTLDNLLKMLESEGYLIENNYRVMPHQ